MLHLLARVASAERCLVCVVGRHVELTGEVQKLRVQYDTDSLN